MKKLAIFDLDYTIISIDSFIALIIFIIAKYPMKVLYLPYLLIITILRIIKVITIDFFKSKWLILFRNINNEQLEKLLKEFFNSVLLNKIKPEALTEINDLRKKNYTLVIATASFEFYVKYLSDYFKFDYLFGTKVKIEKNKIIPEIDGKNCKGEEKIKRITSLINTSDINKSESIGFSDCTSDLSYLQISNTFNLVAKRKWKVLKVYHN